MASLPFVEFICEEQRSRTSFLKPYQQRKKASNKAHRNRWTIANLPFVEFICEEQRCSTPFFKADYWLFLRASKQALQ